jgi:hypothetical protein
VARGSHSPHRALTLAALARRRGDAGALPVPITGLSLHAQLQRIGQNRIGAALQIDRQVAPRQACAVRAAA